MRVVRKMFMLVFLFLWGASLSTAAAQNFGPVNTNGSFEDTEPGVYATGDDIDGWVLEIQDGSAEFEVVEDESAPDGDNVLQITVEQTGQDAWSIQAIGDRLPIIPGETYHLSVWARTDGPSAQAAFTVGNYDYGEYGAVAPRPVTLSGDWTEHTVSFTPNPGANVTDREFARVPLHFSYASNVGTPIYIDNLRVVRTSMTDDEASPVIVEAEDTEGEVGSGFQVIEEDGLTFVRTITDWRDVEDGGDGSVPASDEHVLTYEVTFPSAGEYNLFARVRVNTQDDQGRGGADNDSFFYPDDFGEKDRTDADQWSRVNQIDSGAGWAEELDVVDGNGGAGAGVWKWLNLSKNAYGGVEGHTFVVPEGELTQTFQIGGRETYLDFDKFAFGLADLYYRVIDLDEGNAGSVEWPEDPIDFYEGPPLADGQTKYLGNIYSPSQAANTAPYFHHYWNQVTPENEGKWGSVQSAHGTDPDTWNWGGLDNAYNLAKNNGFPFRFHVLVWGGQQPNFLNDLTDEEKLEAVRTWFQAVADRYEDIDRLEVVNEPLHAPPWSYRDALGGNGDTGWDWAIKAFEMAREIFPDTKLMVNDYGILTGGDNLNRYLGLINLLLERDLIDAIGVQGHHFTMRSVTQEVLKNSLDRLSATGLPVIVTEMDVEGNPNVGDDDPVDPNYSQEESDAVQLATMQRVFPVIWSHPGVEGVTMWGWKLGGWRPGREMNLLRSNGEERPAMTWLREFLAEYEEDDDDNGTSVDDMLTKQFRLLGNYPNPFGPSTTISYELPASMDVQLDVYDMLGRQVKSLVSDFQTAGIHTVTFDGSGLASGMYVYRLQAGDQAKTGRMMLVK